MRVSLIIGVVACALLMVAGCGKKGGAAPGAEPLAKSDLREKFWLAEAPANPKAVGAVKKEAKTGDTVTLIGRVGGAEKVFVDGIAAFTVVDQAAVACTLDHCNTPWDYCCVDAKELAGEMVTVEFVDGEQSVKKSARGFHGLDHLSTVVVTGKVAKDEAGNVTLKATGIHVNP